MIALLKRLPQEIIDYLIKIYATKRLSEFTERKLRPLTLMESDEDKIEKFMEMNEKLLFK